MDGVTHETEGGGRPGHDTEKLAQLSALLRRHPAGLGKGFVVKIPAGDELRVTPEPPPADAAGEQTLSRDESGRLRLGVAEWIAVFGLLGAALAWAQMMHSRLSVIEAVMNSEVPRMTRTLEVLNNRVNDVVRLDQRLEDLDRRIGKLEGGSR
jgi:hypothetical protein